MITSAKKYPTKIIERAKSPFAIITLSSFILLSRFSEEKWD